MRGAALAAALWAGAAAAEGVDAVGTWACTMEVYDSGEIGAPEVFNISLYRDGTWALSGRSPDGAVYQGEGQWRYGRTNAGGASVTVEGQTQKPDAMPEPIAFTVDILGPDGMARAETEYRRTVSVDCGR